MPVTLMQAILNETVLQVQALVLGGATVADVFIGRRPKNYVQAKKISINCYIGDPDPSARPHTTGNTYLGIPVHIHVSYMRMDKITGEYQAPIFSDYMLQILDKLNFLRPGDLSQTITGFFSTKAQIDDIDTETGITQSESPGIDQSVEGYLTVVWEFWRANT